MHTQVVRSPSEIGHCLGDDSSTHNLTDFGTDTNLVLDIQPVISQEVAAGIGLGRDVADEAHVYSMAAKDLAHMLGCFPTCTGDRQHIIF